MKKYYSKKKIKKETSSSSYTHLFFKLSIAAFESLPFRAKIC